MTDGFAFIIIFCGIIVLAILQRLSSGNYEDKHFLTAGTYKAGGEIPVGKADLTAVSGAGNFCVKNKEVKEWNIGNPIGATSGFQVSKFRNLVLNKGDVLEINGSVKIMLSPPVPIEETKEENLVPGTYRFGVDVPPGKYDLEVVSGDGDVLLVESGKDDYTFFQDMAQSDPLKADSFKNLNCTDEYELWVRGSLTVKLNPSNGKSTAKKKWQKILKM